MNRLRATFGFIFSGGLLMGDRDHTFEWLEKAYAERSGRMEYVMEYVKDQDVLEPFHSDPRYIDLLKRMGLPQ